MSSIKLVLPPTADEEVKASVIRMLEESLELAKTGVVDNVIIILRHIDNTWTNKASETTNFTQAVGMLEVTKQEWIYQHLSGQ